MTRARPKDPRQVGGRYWCAYWRKEYTVDAIERDRDSGSQTTWLDVTWEDGRKGRHCTAWDHQRDKVVKQP